MHSIILRVLRPLALHTEDTLCAVTQDVSMHTLCAVTRGVPVQCQQSLRALDPTTWNCAKLCLTQYLPNLSDYKHALFLIYVSK